MSETPGRRVLLIDDDASVREVLSDALQFLGHEVSVAADGRAGLDLFARERYDVVVTDLSMPELSGWDVIERVREADPAIPLVIITGAATDEDIERARQARIPVLRKPVRLEDLGSVVSKAAVLTSE